MIENVLEIALTVIASCYAHGSKVLYKKKYTFKKYFNSPFAQELHC